MSGEGVIDRVIEIVEAKVDAVQRPLVATFMRRYYLGLSADELEARDPRDLYGAALSHWNTGNPREPRTPKIRIYNPHPERHGWQSTHTVVDVVTDDMPFLVDSLRMAISARGLTTYLVVHPVVKVARDPTGHATAIGAHNEDLEGADRESFLHFEVERETDRQAIDSLRRELFSVLDSVRRAVDDWGAMQQKLRETLEEVRSLTADIPRQEIEEGVALLEWLGDDHFAFLGYREYTLERTGNEELLREVPDSGLGILANPGSSDPSASFVGLPPEIRKLATRRELVVPSKANTRSKIHRPGYHDYIAVHRFDDAGEVVGERRFVGLHASTAYNSSVLQIPWIRARVSRVLERAPFPADSHAGRALLNILETFPRDELFHVEDDALYEMALGILHIQERQRVGVLVHRERYGRFYSCLVFIPRDRFNTTVRDRVQKILEETFASISMEFTVQIVESPLARLYCVLRVAPGTEIDYDADELESRIRRATRTWADDLHDAVLEQFGEERGSELMRRYGPAFKADYSENYSPRVAVNDIEKMETIGADTASLAMTLYRPLEAPPDEIKCKLFHAGTPIGLTVSLEMLENMGLHIHDARPSHVERADTGSVWIQDFGMQHSEGDEFDLDEASDRFREAFVRIWKKEVEDDPFNHLVLRAGLDWREVVVIRAYAKYLRQTNMTFSPDYMQQTLTANPAITKQLIRLFQARFDPVQADGTERASSIRGDIESALELVPVLDQDRILRSFLAVILATLRTNFYQTDAAGNPKDYLSFKLEPHAIPDLPEPRPKFEIFVYSPRVEGVHLRAGQVARGGVRWSDRREDFRTEVLGLMKAQTVKNAVIVPHGAKGGFVAKRIATSSDRQTIMDEGKACYRTFIRALLDLTDNIVQGRVVPPRDIVRRDGDDPYLVVAADKGTASFSDIANEIAHEYEFWLGDAFASGGSAGYDHKAMGITARGAWESVKRHFRDTGVDTQEQAFTVVGIGDMSGDVFGNGMLLSDKIRLVGAFDHQHIFLDPDPDAGVSFAERKRLFGLQRSGWNDYDLEKISRGGGVFSRAAKRILLSPEARAVLRVEQEQLTPAEVIQSILRAPVDLLWNGGIGTYVKASSERHGDVGDRTNDHVRVNASELRCKVVGEGGNLGFTQKARVEFAALGGRINTDSIDNSAGVDCSDHEVNIKILLNRLTADGELTEKHRRELLASMTPEVAELVLETNYHQTQALDLATLQAPVMLDVHARLTSALEAQGRLDRTLESLPGVEEIEDRQKTGRGFLQPELAILMAHSKLAVYDALLESELPRSPVFLSELVRYFPETLRVRFDRTMGDHPLAREIVANVVANEIVNRAGITFVFRIQEETGAESADIAAAFVATRQIFRQREMWQAVEALDNRVPVESQAALLLEGRKLVERATRWLLRNRAQPLDIPGAIAEFEPGMADLSRSLTEVVDPEIRTTMRARAQRLGQSGIPRHLADSIATYAEWMAGLNIIAVAHSSGAPVAAVAEIFFALAAELDWHWIRGRINALPRRNRWESLARVALREDLNAHERLITAAVLRADGTTPPEKIATWRAAHEATVRRCGRLVGALRDHEGATDHTMLAAVLRELRGLGDDRLRKRAKARGARAAPDDSEAVA
jgi:glutamate dehydrogenase